MKKNTILKSFSKYVSLNVLGMLGTSFYILADTFFISLGMGASGIAALNLAIPIVNLVNGCGLMLGMGGATVFSIWGSEGKSKKSENVFTNTLIFGALLSVIFIILGLFFPDQISTALGANAETLDMTSIYIKLIFLFSPAFILNHIMVCFVRNDGNPKLAMIGILVGSLANVLLDYIFIFPLGMGMFGAVFATCMAPIISIIILSKHMIKKENSFTVVKTKLRKPIIKGIVSLGFPSLFSELSSGIVIIIFNIIILNLLGNTGVAAYGIISNISLIVVSIYTGLGQGMQPLASRYFGNRDFPSIIKVLKYGIITMITFSVVSYTFIFLFADQIATIFNSEGNQVLQIIATRGLRLYFIAVIFLGLNVVASHFFTAIGDGRPANFVTILRGLIVIVPVVLIISVQFGVDGVWLSFPITEFLVAIISFVTLRNMVIQKRNAMALD